MSPFVLLDVFLLILIALFVPIGFWRGAQREAFVTLGILFGAAIADWWARPWGKDLADMTNLRETAGAFMVAMLFLVGGTFLLGYSAGAAIPVLPSGLLARALGGVIAAGNGALFLSYTLRNFRIYLLTEQDSDFLNDAVVAHFLSTGVGWVLMAGAVIFLPIVLGIALFGRPVEIADFGDEGEDYEAGFTPVPRRFPPRGAQPPMEDDARPAYKTESPARSVSVAEATRPMTISPYPQSRDRPGGERRVDITEEQAIIARAPTNGVEQAASSPARADEPDMAEALKDGKCPNCHADVRAAQVYCPRCGRVL